MFTYFVYMFVNIKIVYTSPPTYRLIRRYHIFSDKKLSHQTLENDNFISKYQFSLKNGVFSRKWRFTTKNTYGKNLKKLSVIFIPLSNQSKIKITDFKLSRFLLIFSKFQLSSHLQIFEIFSSVLLYSSQALLFFNLLESVY